MDRITPAAMPALAERLAKARPFRVEVGQAALDDVRARVRAHRWGKVPAGTGWKHGIDQAWLRSLADHWVDGYDWRAAEAAINRLGNHKAELEGRDVHFVFEPGSGRAPKPLLLLHGWPYSFHTFLDLIPRLAHPERFGGDPEDGFDVVVPSLPGLGFSDPPADAPKGLRFIAGRLHGLMADVLGYERYLVEGGDFGAVAAEWLAIDHAPAVMGVHQHMIGMRHPGAGIGTGQAGEGPPPNDEERAFLAREQQHVGQSGQFAYFMLQIARPETLAAAVADSPVGMAAWMLEKWHYWTDQRERPLEAIYSRDRLLTEVMIYWLSGSFGTSLWPYAGFLEEGLALPRRIEAPVAVLAYPDPLTLVPPRSLVERSRNVARWTERDRGGHFPFVEDPEAFVQDIREFARALG